MGLYLARWWLGLSQLEKAGSKLWKHIQPIGQRLMPVTRPSQALLLGALWGWLPCGLVYSAATWAATAADWQHSALIMLSFGLGTLPLMLVTGQFAQYLKKFIQSENSKRLAAILIIVFGVWTIAGALIYASPNADHSQHMHGTDTATQEQHLGHTMPAESSTDTGGSHQHHQTIDDMSSPIEDEKPRETESNVHQHQHMHH
jgi:sulfite exporter TauE/SafE